MFIGRVDILDGSTHISSDNDQSMLKFAVGYQL